LRRFPRLNNLDLLPPKAFKQPRERKRSRLQEINEQIQRQNAITEQLIEKELRFQKRLAERIQQQKLRDLLNEKERFSHYIQILEKRVEEKAIRLRMREEALERKLSIPTISTSIQTKEKRIYHKSPIRYRVRRTRSWDGNRKNGYPLDHYRASCGESSGSRLSIEKAEKRLFKRTGIGNNIYRRHQKPVADRKRARIAFGRTYKPRTYASSPMPTGGYSTLSKGKRPRETSAWER